MLSEAVSKFLGIEEPPVHPEHEPRNRFSQPEWDKFMGEKEDGISIGNIAPMFRYLYAKIEMLEQRLDATAPQLRPQPFVHPAFPYENPRAPAETEAMLNHMADVHLTPTKEKK
jgi:hypothetical protein